MRKATAAARRLISYEGGFMDGRDMDGDVIRFLGWLEAGIGGLGVRRCETRDLGSWLVGGGVSAWLGLAWDMWLPLFFASTSPWPHTCLKDQLCRWSRGIGCDGLIARSHPVRVAQPQRSTSCSGQLTTSHEHVLSA